MRQQERSLERERLLSGAGAELVAATDRDEIDRVAVVRGRAHRRDAAAVALVPLRRRGDRCSGCRRRRLAGRADASASTRGAWPPQREGARTRLLSSGDAAAAGLPPTHDARARRSRSRRGAPSPPCCSSPAATTASKAERAALRALASQVALALDSAVLSEEVHRRRGEARFASLVRHASDLITVLDADTTVSYQSPSIERILGYDARGAARARASTASPSPATATRLAQLRRRHGGRRADASRSSARSCTATASARQFEILFTNLIDDEHVGGILLNARDVSERKAFEAELAHQAFHDPVTGLANRAMFAEQVRQAIGARAPRGARTPP